MSAAFTSIAAMDAQAVSFCCFLLVTSAMCQITEPRLEAGGWQPILSRSAATPGKQDPKLEMIKNALQYGNIKRMPAKRDRSSPAAEARHDIPAFYVWLPTELLDHIRPNGQNFAQIQAPSGFPRLRPNYLPNQNIDDATPVGIPPNQNVGVRPSVEDGYAVQREKTAMFRPIQTSNLPRPGLYGDRPVRPTSIETPQGLQDIPTPGLGNDLPQTEYVGLSQPAKPRRPSGGYGGAGELPDSAQPDQGPQLQDPKTTYDFGINKNFKDNSQQNFFKPATLQREHKSYNGFDSGYPAASPPEVFYNSVKPEASPGSSRPVEEDHPEVNQLDPRRRPVCSPVTSAAAAVTNLGNRSLRQVADSLGAGAFLDRVGITEQELLSFTGHDGMCIAASS